MRIETDLSIGVIGFYNSTGYRVCRVIDGNVVEDLYTAGNCPIDSQQTVPPDRGVGKEKLRTWCEREAKEEAVKRGTPFFGVEEEEDDILD